MARRHLTRIVTTLVAGALTLTPLTASAAGDEAGAPEEPISQERVLKKANAQDEPKVQSGFSGTHATSDAMSLTRGADSTRDAIAELRAYGADRYTDLDPSQAAFDLTHFTGALEVNVSTVSDTGVETSVALLRPIVNASQLLPTGDFKYLHTDDARELDAHLTIECGDVDGDGIDEIFCYTGAYVDENGTRYAIVDMFRSTDGVRFSHYTTRVAAGAVASYPDQTTLAAHPEQSLTAAPVVTLAAGDRSGSATLTITVSSQAEGTDAGEVVGRAVYAWNGEKLVSHGTDASSVQAQTLEAITSPRVAEATDRSLTLEWGAADFGDMGANDCYYEVNLMRAGEPDHVASSFFVTAHPGEAVVRQGFEGFDPNGTYTFTVRAVRGQQSPDGSFRYSAMSSPSPAFSGRTLAPGESCTADPITSAPGASSLTLTCGGTWTKTVDGEIQDLSPSISFRWYKRVKGTGEWQQISVTTTGGDTAATTTPDITAQAIGDHAVSTLTLQGLTAADDGTEVKCDLGFGDCGLTSNVLTISVGPNAVTTTTPAAVALRVESSGGPAISAFEPAAQSLTTGSVSDTGHGDEKRDEDRDTEDGSGGPTADNGGESQGTSRIRVRTRPKRKVVTLHRSSPAADPTGQNETSLPTSTLTDVATSTETAEVTSATGPTETSAATVDPAPATSPTTPSMDATSAQNTNAPAQEGALVTTDLAQTPAQTQEVVQAPVPVQTTPALSNEPAYVTTADMSDDVSTLAITADPSVPSAVVVFLATTGLALVAPHLPKRTRDKRERQ